MLFGTTQLTMLGVVAAAVLLFVGTIAYHRVRQEVILARWMREKDNPRLREAFRRSSVKARRIEPLLHLYLGLAALVAAGLILYQIAVTVLAAL